MLKRIAVLIFLASGILSAPIKAQAVPHSTKLIWGSSSSVVSASSGTTVAGYNVYKDKGCTGVFAKVSTATPTTTSLSYTDSGQADGEVNCYYVTAIVGTSESTQAQSTIIKVTTPTVTLPTATLPPGAVTFVAQ